MNNFTNEPSEHSPQQKWRDLTLNYVKAVNEYVEKGHQDGWDTAGPEPEDPGREDLVESLLEAIRRANFAGDTSDIEKLRNDWPPAQRPLIEILEKQGQSLPLVYLLPDDSILLRIGSEYQKGKTVRISGDEVYELEEVGFFGRSPNRRYFAISRKEGVEIIDGWEGPQVTMCLWPTGLENIPKGYEVNPLTKPPTPTRLIPFPDGTQVLIVSDDGIFVSSPTSVKRIHPTQEDLRVEFDYELEDDPDEELTVSISMAHGAISNSGDLIAVGSQDSTHLVFDRNFNLIANIGNLSEYPHYSLFSSDDEMIVFNSCHFYNGITVGVPTSLLPGLVTEKYEEDERVPILEDISRVYAGVSNRDAFILGNGDGDVVAVDTDGNVLWHQFIGSSVGNIDISNDGKTLVVSTYAGFVSIFKLDAGKQAPHQIGNGNHLEVRRWIFWKDEEKPLRW